MAQTFGALAVGLATYQPGLPFSGVLGNRVGSQRHSDLIRDSLPDWIRWYGSLPRSARSSCPAATWGWCRPRLADLDARLDAAADALAASASVELPPAVAFEAPAAQALRPTLEGVRIGVARDTSFAFTYQANLDLLRASVPSCGSSRH